MKRFLPLLAVMALFAACEPDDPPAPTPDPDPQPSSQTLRLAPAHDTSFEVGGIMFNMKYVPSGTFMMGATTASGSQGYDPDADMMEQPVHSVALDAYLIAEMEVSQFLYFAVMRSNPSEVSDLTLPVHNVSYTNALRFIDSLNSLTGFAFRLPTEAEWEYAAKGGGREENAYYFSGSNAVGQVGWSEINSGGQVHMSGLLAPNALGLYDMSGNVMEWCSDWYGVYPSSPQTNPQGPEMPSNGNQQRRVMRGGSFCLMPYYLRNTARQFHYGSHESNDTGVRLAISVKKN